MKKEDDCCVFCKIIRGAHLICYPGAFNMTTGPLHWELLQRARAADCQLYVATCSPARDTGSSYVAWGHSTLVGPFGEVLATTEHELLPSLLTSLSDMQYNCNSIRMNGNRSYTASITYTKVLEKKLLALVKKLCSCAST